MPPVRRLAAIVAADVAGYSRLMGLDEAGTARALREHRVAADPLVAEHHGRIVKTTGDGVLIEFASVVGAVECALALQRLAVERNADLPDERRMVWRIGIHIGDVLVEGEDILGDGVNIAARLEGIAEPGGICISEDAFRQVRGKVEVEFADGGEQTLKNIARPLHVYRVGSSPAANQPISPAAALPLPDKPSIAVLPFANMSGDPEQEYFADGMVEEIITALSRIRWLFVIARNSTFTYKGQAVDVKQVARELGVRYVLEGSVRKVGGRVRIGAQLIDALTGIHLWADRFDSSSEEVFNLQDKVALAVAGVVEPALQASEIRRAGERPTENLTAYDLYLRAAQILGGAFEKEPLARASDLLAQAVERDPRFALALGRAAQVRAMLDVLGVDNPDSNRVEALDLARRCVDTAVDDPNALCWAGFALGYFGEDLDAAAALVDRSLALNPSFAEGWLRSGILRLFAGNLRLAIEHVEQSMRLDPRARMGLPLSVLGLAYFFDRRFELATTKLLEAIQEWPSFVSPYRTLAACYAHMGRLDEARHVIERLRALTPVLVRGRVPWRHPEHRQLYLSGVRLAIGEAI
jgi:adenylate cyclase